MQLRRSSDSVAAPSLRLLSHHHQISLPYASQYHDQHIKYVNVSPHLHFTFRQFYNMKELMGVTHHTHYKTNSLTISLIIRLELVVRTIGLVVRTIRLIVRTISSPWDPGG